MADPRGATRRQALQKLQQPVNATDSKLTEELSVTNTEQILELAIVAQKISFQASGTLAGTVEVSINGEDFVAAGAIAGANAIASYSAHNVKWVKVTRSGGLGKLHIMAV